MPFAAEAQVPDSLRLVVARAGNTAKGAIVSGRGECGYFDQSALSWRTLHLGPHSADMIREH